uniref:Uncharacterized protein n=1 Tax=Arundo donax TaxID=35708 RepID=A0A0A9GGM6_ARUDO
MPGCAGARRAPSAGRRPSRRPPPRRSLRRSRSSSRSRSTPLTGGAAGDGQDGHCRIGATRCSSLLLFSISVFYV